MDPIIEMSPRAQQTMSTGSPSGPPKTVRKSQLPKNNKLKFCFFTASRKHTASPMGTNTIHPKASEIIKDATK
jgi:hypothetical protein